MQTLERRFSNTSLRAVANRTELSSSPGTLIGYAAKFSTGANQNWSSDLGGFRERVDRRCFDRSLARGDDVRANINHDPNKLLARLSNQTLKLSTDDIGLHAEIILPNTSYARDVYQSVSRGDLSEMSFAFTCDEDDWSDCVDPDDSRSIVKLRTLKSARLIDVAAVCYPAYASTSIATSDQLLTGRAYQHSYQQLFPQGVSAEVRSRVGDVRANYEQRQNRRRRLVNSVLSI